MATELKTDSRYCYMMYRHDERYMTFQPEEDRKKAVEAGRKYVASAYAEVWTKDAGLVSHVRVFLGEIFHWHNRLSKSGSDQDVAQTLMEMVRGGSIVVIPEEPVRSGGIAWPPKQAAASFWGVENYDETPYVSVKDRYRAQLERMNAERPTWAETEAMMDSINADFMRQMAGSSPLLDSLFQAAGWTDKYAAPNDTGSSQLGDVARIDCRRRIAELLRHIVRQRGDLRIGQLGGETITPTQRGTRQSAARCSRGKEGPATRPAAASIPQKMTRSCAPKVLAQIRARISGQMLDPDHADALSQTSLFQQALIYGRLPGYLSCSKQR